MQLSFDYYTNSDFDVDSQLEIGSVVADLSQLGFVVTDLDGYGDIGSEIIVELKRPYALQILAVAAGILSIFWLWWLTRFADVQKNIGQIVGFFISIWAWRTVFTPAEAVQLVFAEYFILALSISAVTIFVFRFYQDEVRD